VKWLLHYIRRKKKRFNVDEFFPNNIIFYYTYNFISNFIIYFLSKHVIFFLFLYNLWDFIHCRLGWHIYIDIYWHNNVFRRGFMFFFCLLRNAMKNCEQNAQYVYMGNSNIANVTYIELLTSLKSNRQTWIIGSYFTSQ
jgi:hypothetical protein